MVDVTTPVVAVVEKVGIDEVNPVMFLLPSVVPVTSVEVVVSVGVTVSSLAVVVVGAAVVVVGASVVPLVVGCCGSFCRQLLTNVVLTVTVVTSGGCVVVEAFVVVSV